jgi:hypothetical protein
MMATLSVCCAVVAARLRRTPHRALLQSIPFERSFAFLTCIDGDGMEVEASGAVLWSAVEGAGVMVEGAV